MDPLATGSPQEVIEKVSKQLGCSTTSRHVAEYFDQHDKLRDLRQEFLVPKVADLPPCIFLSQLCTIACHWIGDWICPVTTSHHVM